MKKKKKSGCKHTLDAGYSRWKITMVERRWKGVVEWDGLGDYVVEKQ